MYKKMMYFGKHNHLNVSPHKPIEMDEPPEENFVFENAKYTYLGKKTYNKKVTWKVYRTENGTIWRWDSYNRRMRKVRNPRLLE